MDAFRFFCLHASLALFASAACAAYPEKPIRMVVPYPAGGAADTSARIIGQQLSVRLGQSVIIENKPGASGSIGAAAVAAAPADGYTLLLDATGHAVNPSLLAKLPYDTAKDFAPISLLIRIPTFLVVPPASPANNVQELIRIAREKPGVTSFASAGNGTAQHLAGELFAQGLKLQLMHVPYKGGAPALTDLMGGQIDMMFSASSASWPHVKSGKLRALATSGLTRSSNLSDLPTIAESGVPDFSVYEWNGLFGRAGTSAEILKRLETEVRQIMAQPDVRQRFADLGAEPVGSSAAELGEFVQIETAKWAKVIKEAKIRVD